MHLKNIGLLFILVVLVLGVTGCTYATNALDTYGRDTSTKALKASKRVNCEIAPVATVLREYRGIEFKYWLEFCGHKIEGYVLTPVAVDG